MHQSTDKNSIEKQIISLIYIIIFILFVEGALRKWIFPEFSKPLFFIKDPFVIYLYCLLLAKGKFITNSLMTLYLFVCVSTYFLMCVQLLINKYDIIVAMYGFRNYFLMIPMAFIIEKYIDIDDFKKLVKYICLSSIPMSVLVLTQYYSSTEAFINTNVGGSTTEIFTVVSGIVRPSGTFSFTSAMQYYVSLLSGLLLTNYLLKAKAFLSRRQFWLCIFAFFICLALSGSRSVYFSTGIVFIAMVGSSLLMLQKQQAFKTIGLAFSIMVGVVLLFTFVFEEQRDLMFQRQMNASISEGSIFSRAFHGFAEFGDAIFDDLDFLGRGIGLGSGGGAYLKTGQETFLLAETEWGRIILEIGILWGFIYILFRMIMAFSLLVNGLKGLSISSSPIPMLFVGLSFLDVMMGNVTGNGIANAFTWILYGISLCIIKMCNDRSMFT